VVGIRRFEWQQLRQGTRPDVMHRGTDCGRDTFQIELAASPAVAENNAQQLVYLADGFFPDRFGRFFSSANGVASVTGRSAQICSLTANSCSPNSRKRWHSATSRRALARLAGEENISVTVFPFTLRVSRKQGPWPVSPSLWQ
jgi:hypothetical protein